MSGSTNWEQVYKVQSARIEQLERENAALWRDVYQCPPTSEYGYEGLKWADAFEVIERDNAELHNKLATLQHQTQWKCSCGGTDCEGQKENASLREENRKAHDMACEDAVERYRLNGENAALRSLLREAITDHVSPYDLPESEDFIERVKTALGEAKP